MSLPLYLRERDLCGSREITPEVAAANRARGKGPRKPRPANPGLIPVSPATLWRWVRARKFPAPLTLGNGRVTAWRESDVRDWVASQNHQQR